MSKFIELTVVNNDNEHPMRHIINTNIIDYINDWKDENGKVIGSVIRLNIDAKKQSYIFVRETMHELKCQLI